MRTLGKALFSRGRTDWATPKDLFERLDKEFHFTLDAAANETNAKCARYYTKRQDGLQQPWRGNVWLNPPYGSGIAQWFRKASESVRNGDADVVVMLVPVRSDTAYWHSFVWDRNRNRYRPGVEVRYLRGRLKFGSAKNSAPFPSALVIFDFGDRENSL